VDEVVDVEDGFSCVDIADGVSMAPTSAFVGPHSPSSGSGGVAVLIENRLTMQCGRAGPFAGSRYQAILGGWFLG